MPIGLCCVLLFVSRVYQNNKISSKNSKKNQYNDNDDANERVDQTHGVDGIPPYY
jgi:hypothetical protein